MLLCRDAASPSLARPSPAYKTQHVCRDRVVVGSLSQGPHQRRFALFGESFEDRQAVAAQDEQIAWADCLQRMTRNARPTAYRSARPCVLNYKRRRVPELRFLLRN